MEYSIKLEELTWYEVEAYLQRSDGIILPTGSVEQHGPMGLMGTDVMCAREIAWRAADRVNGLVAPDVAYAPAPFNMGFPGTVSISSPTFAALMLEIVEGLVSHGFLKIYLLNGHGANIELLKSVQSQIVGGQVRLRNWWDFNAVNELRNEYFGDWEGMHATPSEISLTQVTHRVVQVDGLQPPRKLSPEYIRSHAGDRHGPANEHRRDFPDGRVGSRSELASPTLGTALLNAAVQAVAEDYQEFLAQD